MVGACRPPTAEMGLMNVTTQPRVYFANRDPVREALQAWRQGTYPGQHLWGTTALEAAGYEVVYSKFGRGHSALERFSSRWMRGSVGNLAQQVEALRSRADVFYTANPSSLVSLPQGAMWPRSSPSCIRRYRRQSVTWRTKQWVDTGRSCVTASTSTRRCCAFRGVRPATHRSCPGVQTCFSLDTRHQKTEVSLSP